MKLLSYNKKSRVGTLLYEAIALKWLKNYEKMHQNIRSLLTHEVPCLL
jgi:hypothetical protein